MKNIDKLYNYFQRKSEEIAVIAKQCIATHNGLIGEHREKIVNIFLSDFLPKKYSIGTGQFMGIEFQRDYESNQSDIIVWDSFDYPKISFQGLSSLFFAESVKIVIEVKSNFNQAEFLDIQKKTKNVKRFVPAFHPTIKEEIWRLDNKIARAVNGKMEMRMMATAPHIAVAAFCFKGGEKFDFNSALKGLDIEDSFPDVLLLLEAGKLIVKTYEVHGAGKMRGILKIHDLKQDSLLGFTGWITTLLADRETLTNSPFQFHEYIEELYVKSIIGTVDFQVVRPAPGIEIIN